MDLEPFSSSFDADTLTLHIDGEIDEETGPALRESISKFSEDHRRTITIDLSRVTFLPSLAVSILATGVKSSRANDAELELAVTDGCLAQRVLQVCALPYRTL